MTVAAVVTAGCGVTAPSLETDEDRETFWQSFSIEQMRSDRARQDVRFLTVMDDGPFRMGILHVPRGPDVGLITHGLNAVYFVVSGEARISTESEAIDVEAGHALFVRGDVEHRIGGVAADLDVVVVFRIATLNETDPEIAAFSFAEMIEGESLEASVWNPQLSTSTVGVGMYLVPKGTDPDAFMIHRTDEFKIITEGTARFDLGAGSILGATGGIAYIPNGVQHQFRRVADPLRVLVIWER